MIAGSHDPLLERAVQESGCDLALMSGGSSDGLKRLELGRAVAAGLHVLDPASGDYNRPLIAGAARWGDLVLIHWAWREQGLIIAPDNPRQIRGIADLLEPGIVIARRQEGAGSQILFRHLLEQSGISYESLTLFEPAMRTETDIAAAVLDGKADCGLAVASVAQRHRLGFIPLRRERYDLAMPRRDYFGAALAAPALVHPRRRLRRVCIGARRVRRLQNRAGHPGRGVTLTPQVQNGQKSQSA